MAGLWPDFGEIRKGNQAEREKRRKAREDRRKKREGGDTPAGAAAAAVSPTTKKISQAAATSLAHPKSYPAIKGQAGRAGLRAGRVSPEGADSLRFTPTTTAKITRPKAGVGTATSGRMDLGPSQTAEGAGPRARPPVTGTPPRARPDRPAGGTARGEDLGPSTSAGAKGPKPRPASYTDRAKVNKEKAKSTKAAAVTGSPPKPRPAAAAQKGGLGGLLSALRSNKDNQRLAKERQAKAGRKG